MTRGDTTRLPDPAGAFPDEPVTVLCVDDDPDFLDLLRSILDDERFVTVTASSPGTALSRLQGVDCVVSDDATGELDGEELLVAVRERRPGLPFVLFTGDAHGAVAASVLAHDGTDVLEKSGRRATTTRLRRRIEQAVEHRRATARYERALAAVETATDGIAIVAPEGTFQFVNRSYAMRFGYDREELLGRPWRSIYTDETVERLVGTALPLVADGWRWTGPCEGRCRSGETVSGETTVGGLDDGSLVFAVSDPDRHGPS